MILLATLLSGVWIGEASAEDGSDGEGSLLQRVGRWIDLGAEERADDDLASFAGEMTRAPTFEWRVRLPGPPMNSASHTERGRPVLSGTEILVGSAAGKGLYRMARSDGALKGVYKANASVESEPLVHEGHVYFADTSGTTFCYRLGATEPEWSNRGNAPVLTRPTIHDGVLYLTNVDDLVVALDVETGDQVWRYKAKRDLTRVAELALYAAPSPIIDGGEVIVGFSNGALVGLDLQEGTPNWTVDVGEGRYPDLVATPLRSGNDVFVSGYFKPLLAIDRETHNVRWRAEAGSAFAATVVDGTLYHPGSDGKLRAFSTLTGAEKWSWSSGTTTALTEPIPTAAGLVVAASNGRIHLVDPVDGRLRWSWDEPELLEGITATPAVSGRQLLFVSNAGFLYSMVAPESKVRERPSNRTLFKGRP